MKTRFLVATGLSLAWSLTAAVAGPPSGPSDIPAVAGRGDPLSEMSPLDDLPRIPVLGKTARQPDLHGPREIDRVAPERDIGPPAGLGVPDPAMAAGQTVPPFISPGLSGGMGNPGLGPSGLAAGPVLPMVPTPPMPPMPPPPPRPISLP